MPAPPGRRRPGEGKAARPPKKAPSRPGRPSPARGFDPQAEHQPGVRPQLPQFRTRPEHRVESAAGMRQEITALRAEVHRLAAEIDKLWARERGRGAAAPSRTARSIAGKPVRTGTRAARPRSAVDPAGPSRGRAGPPARTGPPRSGTGAGGGRGSGGGAKRTGGKRSPGWAKPKSKPRRAGTTPRRQGR